MNKQQLLNRLEKRIHIAKTKLRQLEIYKSCIVDPTSIYPTRIYRSHEGRLWKWRVAVGSSMVKNFGIKSMLDLGCGCGGFMYGAMLAGAKVIGYDFAHESIKSLIPNDLLPHIHRADITEDINFGKHDCVLCVEVAEHIIPQFSKNLIHNIVKSSTDWIIFTAAPPGQSGDNHINMHHILYWKKLFDVYDIKEASSEFIEENKSLWKNLDADPYMLNNLLVYKINN